MQENRKTFCFWKISSLSSWIKFSFLSSFWFWILLSWFMPEAGGRWGSWELQKWTDKAGVSITSAGLSLGMLGKFFFLIKTIFLGFFCFYFYFIFLLCFFHEDLHWLILNVIKSMYPFFLTLNFELKQTSFKDKQWCIEWIIPRIHSSW